MAGCAVVTVLLMAPTIRRGNLEIASRYTFSCDTNQELTQLDPRTGAVLREAGVPFLSETEVLRLKAQLTAAGLNRTREDLPIGKAEIRRARVDLSQVTKKPLVTSPWEAMAVGRIVMGLADLPI